MQVEQQLIRVARVAEIETVTAIEVVVVIEWRTEMEVGKGAERVGKGALWEQAYGPQV